MLVRSNGRPVDVLLEFAKRHMIKTRANMSAQELSAFLQESWLRSTEHQYQVLGEPPAGEDLELLKRMGFVSAVTAPEVAKSSDYKGALLLGGAVVAVRKRLLCLSEQAKNGTVYLLGGARPLDSEKESPEVLMTPMTPLAFKEGWVPPAKMPTTEAGMMQLIFDQSALPEAWKSVLIDTPKQPAADGSMSNPNTTDTVRQFVKVVNPEPGQYLAVSGQPWVSRQTMNVQQDIGRADFKVTGIGHEASPTLSLKTFRDEVARCLYEELQTLAGEDDSEESRRIL